LEHYLYQKCKAILGIAQQMCESKVVVAFGITNQMHGWWHDNTHVCIEKWKRKVKSFHSIQRYVRAVAYRKFVNYFFSQAIQIMVMSPNGRGM
jgi:hypothetical protein